MHPILARGRSLALYLVVFAQAGLLLAEILLRTQGAPRLPTYALVVPPIVVYAFGCLASWYLCRRLPLAQTPTVQVIAAHLGAGALSASLLHVLSGAWAGALGAWSPRPLANADPVAMVQAQAPLFLAFGFLLYSLIAAVHYLAIALETQRQTEARTYELRLTAREAELRALKAQVDPHFLFNSLNAVAALTVPSPRRARRMCLSLAAFLRQSLRHAAVDAIDVAQEVALAERYLEIERERFDDRLAVRVVLADDCAQEPMPPLLLQPLVENAVKHGIAQMIDGGTVRVDVRRDRGAVRLEVTNPCDPERRHRPGEGIGLANVARRLAAIYEGRASLESGESAGRYKAVIRLPRRASKEVL